MSKEEKLPLGLGAFSKLTRTLWGTGLGRLPLTMRVHRFLYSLLTPKGIVPIGILGNTMFIDTRDITISPSLLVRKIWEPYTTELFTKVIRPGDTVVDVGAHWGYYTLLAAQLVGPKGKVYAIEPETKNLRILMDNIEMNGYRNVIVMPYAIGDERSEKPFYISKISGDSSLFPIDRLRGITTVKVITLDELFWDTKIDVIKIDVEGAEGLVLQGMEETIKSNGSLKIFMELWPTGPACGITALMLTKLQDEYGFSIHSIDEKDGCTRTFYPERMFEIKKVGNLYIEKSRI